jgi:hypothetical protein
LSDEWLEIYEALMEEKKLLMQFMDRFFLKWLGSMIENPCEGVRCVYVEDGSIRVHFDYGLPKTVNLNDVSEVYRNIEFLVFLHGRLIDGLKAKLAEEEESLKRLRERLMPVILANRMKKE